MPDFIKYVQEAEVTFLAIGELLAGAPEDHDGNAAPWLQAAIDQYRYKAQLAFEFALACSGRCIDILTGMYGYSNGVEAGEDASRGREEQIAGMGRLAQATAEPLEAYLMPRGLNIRVEIRPMPRALAGEFRDIFDEFRERYMQRKAFCLKHEGLEEGQVFWGRMLQGLYDAVVVGDFVDVRVAGLEAEGGLDGDEQHEGLARLKKVHYRLTKVLSMLEPRELEQRMAERDWCIYDDSKTLVRRLRDVIKSDQDSNSDTIGLLENGEEVLECLAPLRYLLIYTGCPYNPDEEEEIIIDETEKAHVPVPERRTPIFDAHQKHLVDISTLQNEEFARLVGEGFEVVTLDDIETQIRDKEVTSDACNLNWPVLGHLRAAGGDESLPKAAWNATTEQRQICPAWHITIKVLMQRATDENIDLTWNEEYHPLRALEAQDNISLDDDPYSEAGWPIVGVTQDDKQRFQYIKKEAHPNKPATPPVPESWQPAVDALQALEYDPERSVYMTGLRWWACLATAKGIRLEIDHDYTPAQYLSAPKNDAFGEWAWPIRGATLGDKLQFLALREMLREKGFNVEPPVPDNWKGLVVSLKSSLDLAVTEHEKQGGYVPHSIATPMKYYPLGLMIMSEDRGGSSRKRKAGYGDSGDDEEKRQPIKALKTRETDMFVDLALSLASS